MVAARGLREEGHGMRLFHFSDGKRILETDDGNGSITFTNAFNTTALYT